MHVDAGTTAFVDDTRANVDGAEACGMHGVHFRDAAALAADLHALGLLTSR
jgi:2-haloacid dehalogenase